MTRQTFTTVLALSVLLPLAGLRAQQVPPPPPPPTNPTAAQQPGAPPQPGRGGGRGRANVQVMTLSTTAWTDGGQIPLKYTQAGDELSPPLTWSGAPEGTASFVLIVHDLDAMINPPNDYTAPLRDTSDVLHWLVWNIAATATGLPEGVPQGPQLPDGTRQISQTGPYYRGPAAPASGPAHHYVFELYALDGTITIPNTDTSPAEVRAAVKAAMATHIRGKAAMVGLYKR
jgi:Raf kinase inhibitor-like YbhB/YbcL family protein